MPFGETITSPKCSGNCLEVMLGSKVNQCPASHIFFCIRYPREVLILGLYFPQSWVFPFQKSCAQTFRSTVVAHMVGTPCRSFSSQEAVQERPQHFLTAEPDPFQVCAGAASLTSVELLWHEMRMNQACSLSSELWMSVLAWRNTVFRLMWFDTKFYSRDSGQPNDWVASRGTAMSDGQALFSYTEAFSVQAQ